MRVLMLAQSPIAGDSRILREAVALRDAGNAVTVIGRSVPDGWAPPSGVVVRTVGKGRGLRPGSADPDRSSATWERVGRWLLLPEHRARVERRWRAAALDLATAEQGRADVVHAHDFNALEAGAELADRWDARLVYDSHEWWSGRHRDGRPEPLRRRSHAATERRLVRRSDLVLTVSEGIAQRLSAIGARRVFVVRNTFPSLDASYSAPSSSPSAVVYAGRIGSGRDLETLVAAASDLRPLEVLMLGERDASFRLPASDVSVRASLPVDDVDEVYRSAGIAVVPLVDSCVNHRLALPNKLFHAVRAGVPVVAADLPELRRAVTGLGIGALYTPGDPRSLVDAVDSVVRTYPELLDAVRDARTELSWERDAAALLTAYDGLDAAAHPTSSTPEK